MSTSNYDKFRSLLAELFQMDRVDLDFGVYRIMNTKREEINRFLDVDLLPQVRTKLSELQAAEKVQLERELDAAKDIAKQAGLEIERAPKVIEIQERLRLLTDAAEVSEQKVFSHLYDFFRRYYDKGDFI